MEPAGRPRLVPLCFALGESPVPAEPSRDDRLVLYSAIDEKPKRTSDPLALARVRDLVARPTATVLVDRWDEDWTRLAWVRLDCRGDVLAPDGPRADERRRAIGELRAKYPQYADQRLEERPLLRLDCTVAAAWGDLSPEGAADAGPEPDVEAM